MTKKVPGWLWGTREEEKEGVAEGILLDVDDKELGKGQSCESMIPIFWEDGLTEKPQPKTVTIRRNSVNFLKVEALQEKDKLKVQLQGC